MLRAVVSWALHMRVLVVALSGVLLVVRVRSARHAPLDVFPEFAPPMAEIQTEAPGLSTEQVDALVTVPLERLRPSSVESKSGRAPEGGRTGLGGLVLTMPGSVNWESVSAMNRR
jgi:Cu/Ag efflux pump CusA